jgi:hypothetical protein
MDVHKRIFVVTCNIKRMKFSDVKERYWRRFYKPCPTDNAIRVLVNKFKGTRSVHGEKSVDAQGEHMETLNLFAKCSKGIRNYQLGMYPADWLCQQQQLTASCFRLWGKPYHIQKLHDLHEECYPRREAVCAELVDRIQNDNLKNHILFSDEATFHICSKINRRNCRMWDTIPRCPNCSGILQQSFSEPVDCGWRT